MNNGEDYTELVTDELDESDGIRAQILIQALYAFVKDQREQEDKSGPESSDETEEPKAAPEPVHEPEPEPEPKLQPEPEPECTAQAIFDSFLTNPDLDLAAWRDGHAKLVKAYPRKHKDCFRILWKMIDVLEQRDGEIDKPSSVDESSPGTSSVDPDLVDFQDDANITPTQIDSEIIPLDRRDSNSAQDEPARQPQSGPSPLVIDLARDICALTSARDTGLSYSNAANKLVSVLLAASAHDSSRAFSLVTEAVSLERDLLRRDPSQIGAGRIVRLDNALGKLYALAPSLDLLRERISLVRQALLVEPSWTRLIKHLADLLSLLYDQTSDDSALYEAQALRTEYIGRNEPESCMVLDQMEAEYIHMYTLTDVEVWVVQHASLVQAGIGTHSTCPGRILAIMDGLQNIFQNDRNDMMLLAREAVGLINRGMGMSHQLRALNVLYQRLRASESSPSSALLPLITRINTLVSGTKHRVQSLEWLSAVVELKPKDRHPLQSAALVWEAIARFETDTMPILEWVNPERLRFNDETKQTDITDDFTEHFTREAREFGDVDTMSEGPQRALALMAHAMRIMSYNKPKQISIVIGALYEAVQNFNLPQGQRIPPGHPLRHAVGSLGHALTMRYRWFADAEDIEQAVRVLKYAMAGAFDAQDQLLIALPLATAFETRYRRLGDEADAAAAVGIAGRLLLKKPTQSESLLIIAYRLFAKALECYFDASGGITLLDHAAGIIRKALRPMSSNHWAMADCLGILGSILRKRFLHVQLPKDLAVSEKFTSAAIMQQEEAGGASQELPYSRTLYAETMLTKYEHDPNPKYLDTAITSFRWVLDELGHEEVLRADANYGYGNALRVRNQGEDLAAAVHHLRQALLVQPDTRHSRYPLWATGLSVALVLEFRKTNNPATLDEAVALSQTAVSLVSDKATMRADIYAQLGEAKYLLFESRKHPEDLDACLLAFEVAANSETSPRPRCLKYTRRWEDIASNHDHHSLWQALDSSLGHQNKLAGIALNAKDRHAYLVKNPTSASRAAARAIQQGNLHLAVEYLERGRSILWRQTLELRASLESLRHRSPVLAGELGAIVEEIDSHANTQEVSETSLTFMGILDPDLIQRRNRDLSERYDTLLDHIRQLPGFSDFLRPFSYSDTEGIAAEGPVIVLNLCEEGCDALVFLQSGVHHVPLPSAKFETLSIIKSGITTAASRIKYDGGAEMDSLLPRALRKLWLMAVEPIATFIKTKDPAKNRLFWCVTGLTELPIHAAGPYRAGQLSLPDMFISSYTPTLSALVRGRKAKQTTPVVRPRLLAVAQTQTSGFTPLPFALEEISELKRLEVVSTELLDDEAHAGAVMSQLHTHSWVHLCCHGTSNAKLPLLSAFHLAGSRLNIESLMRAELPLADFAFLGACHSAEGSEAQNESMSLASSLQVAGFRSIVATMYAVGDEEGPVVTRELYKYLFRDFERGADSSDAALGLNKAVRVLRLAKVPWHRWVPFIHIGV